MPGALEEWPALPLEEWEDTYQTLHLWTQIVGKVRLVLTPLENQWWNSALYVNARGLTTSPIAYDGGAFEMEFDFISHRLELRISSGREDSIALAPKSVAAFYREVFAMLGSAGIKVHINPMPQELPNPIPLDQDETHASYDREYAHRWWRILLACDGVFREFRAHFVGKASPVHFFWGSFDLAATRFCGRRAPPRKGIITSEAYSEECSSLGWWPGGGEIKGPAFYAYMAPEPGGYATRASLPAGAFYHQQMHEYLLMYDDVRRASSPREEILKFAQATYSAGAELAKWDRAALERNSEPAA